MIDRLRKLDHVVLELTETVYLWLWDHFGLYLASCGWLIMVTTSGVALVQHPLAVGIGTVALGLFVLLPRYWLQQTKRYAVFNAYARTIREGRDRPVYLGVMIALLLSSLDDLASVSALSGQLLTMGYLLGARIRDRQPKDLFAALRPQALAGGAA